MRTLKDRAAGSAARCSEQSTPADAHHLHRCRSAKRTQPAVKQNTTSISSCFALLEAGKERRLKHDSISKLLSMQVVEALEAGHQAMVFVHSRKDAGKTGRTLVTKAQQAGQLGLFDCSQEDQYAYLQRDIRKSRNKCVFW